MSADDVPYVGGTELLLAMRQGLLRPRSLVDLKRIVFATWWNVPIYAWSYRDTTLTKNGEKFGDKDVRFLSMKSEGDDWFGNHFICFTCELPAAGRYRISLDVIKGPSQGKVQLFRAEFTHIKTPNVSRLK